MKKNYGNLYTAPLLFWLTFFFAVPTIIILVISFMKKGIYGGVEWAFSLEGYRELLQPAFLRVVLVTLYISIISSLITLLLAIPTSYYIARSRLKNLFLLLIIVPFWTNFLIRIFAWMGILGNNGLINQALLGSGIIEHYIQFLYSQKAVILVTIYVSLPYAILPLYATIEKFDFSLIEAARDLGASKRVAFFKVFLPNIRTGIITAVIFTLIPTLGSYAVPQLVGGNDSYMVGNIIATELNKYRNWPFVSSISVILTVITTIGVVLFMKLSNKPRKPIEDFADSARGNNG